MPSQRMIRTAYHLVDERNWGSIEAQGLLSTKRLAAASGYDLLQLRLHRAKGLTLPSGVRIRDQSPMPPGVLEKYLQDKLSPEDWYDLLKLQSLLLARSRQTKPSTESVRRRTPEGARHRRSADVGKARKPGGCDAYKYGKRDAGSGSSRLIDIRSVGTMDVGRMGVRESG